MSKLIVKNAKSLLGCDVVYKSQVIREIYISDRFLNTFDNPHPSKKRLSHEDILSIICDYIPNSSGFKNYRPKRGFENEKYYDLYNLAFKYNGLNGIVELSVSIDTKDHDEGILVIESLTYNGCEVCLNLD